MNLRNTTVAITGASAGIGAAIAREMAPKVRRLVLIARRVDRLEALAAELPCESIVEECDLTDPAATEALGDRLVELEIDGLVNNAGLGASGDFHRTDPERIERIIQLNVVSVVRLTRRVLPELIARRHGFVFNVGSMAGMGGAPYMAVYGATKSFLNDFSEALAAETRHSGVRVGVICPGSTSTEFFDAAGIPADQVYKVFESAESVARNAVRAIEKERVLVVSGRLNATLMVIARLVPSFIRRSVTLRLLSGLRDRDDSKA